MSNDNETKAEVFVYRLIFSRQGPAIWLGHLDMMRTFERALRRAAIPLSWSQGYNPRPQMVFALPISVGLAAEADLIDVSCAEKVDESDFLKRINDKLPEGLAVSNCNLINPGRSSLMSLVSEAVYRIEVPGICETASRLLQGNEPLITEKTRKGKTSELDIRALLLDWKCVDDNSLDIRVKAGSSSNLRPDLMLKLLTEQGGLDNLAAADAMITRMELVISEE